MTDPTPLCGGDTGVQPTARQEHEGHEHGGHAGHSHGVSVNADRRYLVGALSLLALFMVGEIIVAFMSGSLALLSDAGHMLSDVGAIAAALWAMHLAAQPARGRWTYGWKRAEILSAAGNGVTLLVVSGIIAFEAIRRLIHPPEVEGGAVVVVALVGVVVNIAAAWLLARANRSSLNVEGAYQHILTDLYGFIGTVVAGVVILLTGWTRADPIASLVVVALMLYAAWGLLRDSGRILLEGAPRNVDLDDLRAHLLETQHVRDVHDLHVWTVTSDLPAVSVHVVVEDECFADGHAPQLLDHLQACLHGHFDVEHSTFQLEPASHSAHEPGTH
ncbi:MAG TPA: cation diffusion facilitator family transporter [Flexivirga sp.]|uniref:cation diffusion facilitator family transporter n=1 Tax=Flexivirga sp. TaxID=1962927 RepID=UPI002BBBC9FA|nr:cation diffusion facilitator family transporter [Flexivirga sp.]HWC24401.1 cation diffusion facilitator family transporter [Flexivirga sp.]